MDECDLKELRKRFKFMSSKNSIKNLGMLVTNMKGGQLTTHEQSKLNVGAKAMGVKVLATQTYYLTNPEVKLCAFDKVKAKWSPKGIWILKGLYFEIKTQ